MQILVLIGTVGASPYIGEILPLCDFLPRCMQTRYCDEISVRLSVRLSVTRVNCDKTVERSVQIYILYERTFILVF